MLPVREIAKGKWHGILRTLGMDDKYLKNKHCPCPVCKGTDRYRFDDKEGDGTFFCSSCGAGDGVRLVMLFKNCDFKNAAMQIEQAAGFVKSAKYEAKKTDEYLRTRLRKLYEGSKPVVHGDPVTEYLEKRGIRLAYIPPSLRFHPELMYFRDGEDKAVAAGAFDAMLGVISAPDGTGATIHRTWIQNGQKAPVASPKKIAQGLPIKGGAIRLTPVHEVLGVAEGIETALAAAQLFGIPTWACVSAGGMESWIPPAECRAVRIFGDNDANFTGQKAAFALANRLSLAGLDVVVQFPETTGEDWADVIRK